MCCILCLRAAADDDPLIDIFSVEGQIMQVQSVIEKYFWLQPEATSPVARMICPDCWQSLRTFHDFYLQIVSAHNALKTEAILCEVDDISPIGALEMEHMDLPIKPDAEMLSTHNALKTEAMLGEEDDISPIEALDIENMDVAIKLEADAEERQTRRRTAAKRNKASKVATPQAAVPVRKRGRPRKQKVEHATDAPAETRALDLHDESEEVASQLLAQLAGSDMDDNALLDSDCEKPHEESEKKLVTRRSDEYIALNFKLSCCLCHASLGNFSELKAHFRTQHDVRGYVLCCGKKLLKRGVLVDHLHTHQNPEYFKCKQCDKVMSDRRCLELHMKGHDDKRERIYQCNVCAKSFYRQSVFRRHLLLHLPEDQKTVSCPQCDKTFATTYIMNQHLKLVHMNAYTKICDVCGKSIRGREALQRHQAEHTGVPRAAIQCELCGGTFTTKYGLARHLKMMHTEENLQPHVCSQCSKVSPSLSAHKRHMKYVHSMQRKHACPMCDKAFKRMTELREHMTTHTGEVLYTCPHCPKTFNSNANMHSHRKKKHRKEWEERRSKRYGPAPKQEEPRLFLTPTTADKLNSDLSA